MGRQLPAGYVGKAEAAHELGVDIRSVTNMVQRGVLVARRFTQLRGVYFALDDLRALRAARTDPKADLQQVKGLALMALSAARRTELRMLDIFAHLGLEVVPLERDPSAINALREEMSRPVTGGQVRQPHWVRYWAGCFFAMDEIYFELVALVTGSAEPWKLYVDFGTELARRLLEEKEQAFIPTQKVLEAARNHLRHVGYMYCTQTHRGQLAKQIFGNQHTAVSEIEALLNS